MAQRKITFGCMDFKPHHIVWIAQWYPHEGEPYAGDFIQRHAQAVSAFLPLTVYSCFAWDGDEKTEVAINGNLTEVITYFRAFKTGIAKLDKVIYWNRWYRILQNLLVKHEQERGRPQLLHCHIILNAGWLGLWAKKKWSILYVVTEHWAGYMKGALNGFDAYNRWSKGKFKQIVQQAAVITGVSQALITALKALEQRGRFERWPNLVNEKIFFYHPSDIINQEKAFIHVSTLGWQKNVDGIFEALAAVKIIYPNIILKIAGPENAAYRQLSEKLQLHQNIVWLGEMAQDKLAEEICRSAALILFSRYESFGCVVIEANAAGVPVIVSDIEPMKELVANNVNGLLVKKGDVNLLAGAMLLVAEGKISFDSAAVSQETLSQYSYSKVGSQMVELYRSVLNNQDM